MDDILTQFVARTKVDPALAQDLLEATGWDLNLALAAYEGFNVTYEPPQEQTGMLHVSNTEE